MGLLPPQLDRPPVRRRPADLGPQHLGGVPAAGRQRAHHLAPWRHQQLLQDGTGTRIAWQHDGRMLPDGELTFFDDGSNPPDPQPVPRRAPRARLHDPPGRSPAVRLHPQQPRAAGGQPGQHADARGTGTRSWATAAYPRSASTPRGGSLLFDAHMPFDMSFYRAFRFPGRDARRPLPRSPASVNNTGEETIVHASWNGATGVAAWRVLAGSAPGSLKTVRRGPLDRASRAR